MINFLKRVFKNIRSTEKTQAKQVEEQPPLTLSYDARCAMAAMMLDLGSIDGVFQEEEKVVIINHIYGPLDLSESDIKRVEIIRDDMALLRNLIDGFSLLEKRYTVGLLWLVARADDRIDPNEKKLIEIVCRRFDLPESEIALVASLLQDTSLDSFTWATWKFLVGVAATDPANSK